MSKYNDETLTEDIRALAQALLDDPATGPSIRDAGVHRDFTDDELKMVGQWCWQSPFISSFKNDVGYEINSRYRNTYTAIAVARRVAQGDFTSVNDKRATKMIEENMNILWDKETKKYIRYGSKKQNFYKSIKYEKFLPILKEFVEKPGLREMINHWMPIYERNNGDRLASDVVDAWAPIQTLANLLLYRYGFIRDAPLDVVGKDVILQNIDLENDAAARDVCAGYNGVDFGEGE